jgi:hypothetical protein
MRKKKTLSYSPFHGLRPVTCFNLMSYKFRRNVSMGARSIEGLYLLGNTKHRKTLTTDTHPCRSFQYAILLLQRSEILTFLTRQLSRYSHGMEDRGVGVRVLAGSRIFSFPCCPDRFCGPTSLTLCPGIKHKKAIMIGFLQLACI